MIRDELIGKMKEARIHCPVDGSFLEPEAAADVAIAHYEPKMNTLLEFIETFQRVMRASPDPQKGLTQLHKLASTILMADKKRRGK